MSLRARAATGIRWQGIASATVQVLQAGVALLVAAMVTPSEFALVGIAAVLFNAQYLVAGSLGLGLAIIQVEESQRFKTQIDSAFLLMGCLGAIVGGITFLMAPQLADLFSEGFSHADVTLVIRLMSITLLFAGLTDIPQGLLERTLSFKHRGLAELIAITAYVALTVVLLAAHSGVWSIIIARVAQSVLLFALFFYLCSPRPQLRWRASWSALAPLLRYGGYVGLSAIIAFLALNIDNVVVGHLAGAAALGVYTIAFALVNMVPTFLTNTLAKVAFPVFSAVRSDQPMLTRAYGESLHALLVVMLPVTGALIAFSPGLLVTLLGPDWRDAGVLVQAMAFYGFARAVGVLAVVLENSRGRPQLMLVTTAIALIIPLALAWPLFRNFDLIGLAWAFTIGQLLACFVAVIASGSLLLDTLSTKHFMPLFSTVVSLICSVPLQSRFGSIASMSLFACIFVIVEIRVDRAFRSHFLSIVLIRKTA